MKKVKYLLAKLAYRYLEFEIINIMSDDSYEQAVKEAEEKGYTRENMNEYYADMQDRKERPIYEAGYNDGYDKAMTERW